MITLIIFVKLFAKEVLIFTIRSEVCSCLQSQNFVTTESAFPSPVPFCLLPLWAQIYIEQYHPAQKYSMMQHVTNCNHTYWQSNKIHTSYVLCSCWRWSEHEVHFVQCTAVWIQQERKVGGYMAVVLLHERYPSLMNVFEHFDEICCQKQVTWFQWPNTGSTQK